MERLAVEVDRWSGKAVLRDGTASRKSLPRIVDDIPGDERLREGPGGVKREGCVDLWLRNTRISKTGISRDSRGWGMVLE